MNRYVLSHEAASTVAHKFKEEVRGVVAWITNRARAEWICTIVDEMEKCGVW